MTDKVTETCVLRGLRCFLCEASDRIRTLPMLSRSESLSEVNRMTVNEKLKNMVKKQSCLFF